jgi:hypothetical protein
MIDRERLVRRHGVVLTSWHPSDTLSLGNGDFAIGVDVTGLQTFPEAHELPPRPALVTDDTGVRHLPERPFTRDDFPVPLRTQSTWGWYQTDPGRRYTLDEASTDYPTRRGVVRYPDRLRLGADGRPPGDAGGWLYANPRRLDLGRIGFRFARNGIGLDDIAAARVELDLWTGCVRSEFEVLERPVRVCTVVHPYRDLVATQVSSPLLATAELAVAVTFPGQRDPLGETERLAEHTTYGTDGALRWADRSVGDARYHVVVGTDGVAGPQLTIGAIGDTVCATVAFGPDRTAALPPFDEVRQAAAAHWRDFWTGGAAVSFAGSTDPRAAELERRVVLSQYLTAVHCAGSAPPQETGLVHNSWGGKFHLEMHWWHAAHFVLWGRPALLERGLGWYREILPRARETARRQGYAGVRWPKQVGPDGRESPSEVGAFLIWQQPHPIYYAELLWRHGQDPAVLDRYRDIVFATADFMADFAEPDDDGRYHLGPPVVPAQESYYPDRARTADPTFELAYWHWGLHVAQQWRLRLGLDRCPRWDDVRRCLVRPHVRDGAYAAVATEPYLVPDDHPSVLMALGFLPGGPLVDPDLMSATFDKVLARWRLFGTWGWDYPVLAMCATRLGRPEVAVDALLMDTYKNHWMANGHVPQLPGGLSVYLPANGGLLAAVAMMVGGWDGSGPAPGFPVGDAWRAEHEGLGRFPADLTPGDR